MSSPEERIQKMLSDPHWQAFVEAMAEILVHQSNQAARLEEETEEMPAGGDDDL